MKYIMTVRDTQTNRVWEEDINETNKFSELRVVCDESAIEMATETIEYFNATLRVGEYPRELVSVSDGDSVIYVN